MIEKHLTLQIISFDHGMISWFLRKKTVLSTWGKCSSRLIFQNFTGRASRILTALVGSHSQNFARGVNISKNLMATQYGSPSLPARNSKRNWAHLSASASALYLSAKWERSKTFSVLRPSAIRKLAAPLRSSIMQKSAKCRMLSRSSLLLRKLGISIPYVKQGSLKVPKMEFFIKLIFEV